MGATPFSATLSDWSEDFQDGFTDFKSGEGKDDFDFPPFSVEAKNETSGPAAGHVVADLDTPASSADPFGEDDHQAAPASKPLEETADMETVVLAPKVHDTPAIHDESTTAGTPSASPAASSAQQEIVVSSKPKAAVQMQMEVVPLADQSAPLLKKTVSVEGSDLPTTATTPTTASTSTGAQEKDYHSSHLDGAKPDVTETGTEKVTETATVKVTETATEKVTKKLDELDLQKDKDDK